jgi:hypothetical protein
MGEHTHVEAARIPDRDRLLQELLAAGFDAHPTDQTGIEVRTNDDTLLAEVELLITSLDAPFVPVKHEGVIYIGPPGG